MARQGASEAAFIILNYNITIVGKIWLVLTIFLRISVLFLAGYPLYQDEQERFVCNTIQPGCANVCYDIFAPLSLFRFWLVQLTSTILVHFVFIVYVIHKVTSSLPYSDASDRMRFRSFYKIKQEPFHEASLSKSSVKAGTRRLPCFTGVYIFQLLVRILLEAGFGTAHYYLFGFYTPKRFICQHTPCTTMVDCYISRPTEKTIMLNFMLGLAALSLLLSLFDLVCASKQSGRHRSKKKIMVENMYEEEGYFLAESGANGVDFGDPETQAFLVNGSFRKRISKACVGDNASMHLEGKSHPGVPCAGVPVGINLGVPSSIGGNGPGCYQVVGEEIAEREGSEVALCPSEPVGTPRSIRVNKRSRLKPMPPPRRDKPPNEGLLDSSGPVTTCDTISGQYMLGDISTDSDLMSTGGDGYEKRSEWV
ncbi:gap junction delta-4 protein [Tachysurus vachellii]|uniref:gap junction delta-4 protein n=1 Tax=Tachysurus vachellii TaxID=175792 RepID=UPI00296B36FB|nr:gap junction delta-4 protein [Tachysurus vachellii]